MVVFVWLETFAISGWYPLVAMQVKLDVTGRNIICTLDDSWLVSLESVSYTVTLAIARFKIFRWSYAILYARIGIPIVFFTPVLLITVLSVVVLLLIARRRRGRKHSKFITFILRN